MDLGWLGLKTCYQCDKFAVTSFPNTQNPARMKQPEEVPGARAETAAQGNVLRSEGKESKPPGGVSQEQRTTP